MTKKTSAKLPNRLSPYSQAFTQFIPEDWAPYPDRWRQPTAAMSQAKTRRQSLAAQFPGDALVIPAGGYKVRSNDCDYRFRPHSAFAHLTGLGEDFEPRAVLVLRDDQARLYFHGRVDRLDPEFYSSAEYGEMWVGARPSLSEMAIYTTLEVRDLSALKADLAKVSADGVGLRVLPGVDPDIDAYIAALRGPINPLDQDLVVASSELRLVKDSVEIEQMVQACQATLTGFEAVIEQLPEAVTRGRGERWVEGVFGLYARHAGNAVGYDTIAAAGDHACTLHWVRNDGELRDGDLLLLDAGVELDSLYTADITRTLPVNGHFTPAQRQVYEAVLAAQEAGLAAARPGARFSDVHQAAVTVICQHLDGWGLLPVSLDQALSPDGGQWRRWMVHGTSHHLGIDVHDCAAARREHYRDGILEPGMVITVEPGLYFKATDLKVPEVLRGIGVRIEDDIVITDDGCRILSDMFPRDPDAVEAWMAKLLPKHA
ncbi:MAG: aminopeptidase P N-terminal domain-containing protein [Propionibacteriaceae bacterium]|jgi:Xaa-Pro aminopeptidase|nr:aminopeptidase P N-terminal domain-containing protein [Propionibacteriaceae bacterium]